MKRYGYWLVLLFSYILAISSGELVASEFPQAADRDSPHCSREITEQLCTPAIEGDSTVYLTCSIDFSILDCQSLGFLENSVTKKILIRGDSASDLNLNFNGAIIDAGPGTYNYQKQDIIEVSSVPSGNDEWLVPKNVTVKNAIVRGSVRIFGMGPNSESLRVNRSSQKQGHLERVRNAAPSLIQLENLTVEGTGRNLVYFGPGVHHSSLIGSTLTGVSKRVGVYLDAESYGNTIESNEFDVHTDDGSWLGFYDRGWPQIAIDGSSKNRIVKNVFKQLDNGGIYLYRNCGEGGTVRYGTPSHNEIANNRFELLNINSSEFISPVIFLGSRNYGRLENSFPTSHCNDDQKQGLNVGSARSNADFAQSNQVISNVFTRKRIRGLVDTRVLIGNIIKVGNPRLDRFNHVAKNEWISH